MAGVECMYWGNWNCGRDIDATGGDSVGGTSGRDEVCHSGKAILFIYPTGKVRIFMLMFWVYRWRLLG